MRLKIFTTVHRKALAALLTFTLEKVEKTTLHRVERDERHYTVSYGGAVIGRVFQGKESITRKAGRIITHEHQRMCWYWSPATRHDRVITLARASRIWAAADLVEYLTEEGGALAASKAKIERALCGKPARKRA